MPQVRLPAVAGLFYPAAPAVLARQVDALLAGAHPALGLRPKAIVVPHAGYVYSGPIAASAYALLAPLRDCVHRIVLLGPVHRVWVPGLALPGAEALATPLGEVAVDAAAVATLADLPQVTVSAAAHAAEHSLEVQLPFLQRALAEFSLVPLAVGGASAAEVAEVLDRLWGGDETLVVISSDLSHYHPYAAARAIDAATVAAVLDLRGDLGGEQACGAHALNGLLLAARRRRLSPHLLDLRNSGDTAGERSQVVGYAALAFTENGHDDTH